MANSKLYRCFDYVEITQVPTTRFPNRNKVMSLNYVNKFQCTSGWENLTNNATVVIPKNVVAKDLNGNDVPLLGTNINIGNGDNPLFLRGDRITVSSGYWYVNDLGAQVQDVTLKFEGFISKVHSKMPITLECEDNGWILKQIKAPDKVYGDGVSIQSIITDLVKGTGLVVATKSTTKVDFNVGTFFTKNETVMQVLARIKNVYKIGVYVHGNEIRIGYPTYYQRDVQNPSKPFIFRFQKNIISDNLEYQRKEDIVISATAESYYVQSGGGSTKDGATKGKTRKLMVFVSLDAQGNFKSQTITNTSQIPQNVAGERMTFFFPYAKTAKELTELAKNELQKKYYTGFKGYFTTFGIPFIPMGDNVKIEDPILQDRNGTYKVKSVTYMSGVTIGQRQVITLDYKIDV
jgi:hypothetical protein